ncbi:hypothetical protein ACIA5D_17800 [Actinoplanes sp. NPDC051513]|uniref:hypothetical protein n=1 Tax=Actinoplanes sp. NPDC051513 TaxID=3363908 RepID=UPI0037B88C27
MLTTDQAFAELSLQERVDVESMLGGLHARGYVDRKRFNEYTLSVRIRHRGQQYPQAYTKGTGVIVAITERPDSSWSQSHGGPDIEMVIAYDEPRFGGTSRISVLADYHVEVVEVAAR